MAGDRRILIYVTLYCVPFISSAISNSRTALEIKDGDTCVTGQSYKQDCNSCHCISGSRLVCTKMLCLRQSFLRSLSKVCVPGKFHAEECSRCFCNQEAKLVCGPQDCRMVGKLPTSHEQIHAHIPYTPSEQDKLPALQHQTSQCTPGYSYRVDCNSCLCLANAKLVCGNRLCPSHDDMHRVTANDMSANSRTALEIKDGDTCVTGQSYKQDCNSCHCISGSRLVCTKMLCLRQSFLRSLSKVCVPGKFHAEECSRCFCNQEAKLVCGPQDCRMVGKVPTSHEQIHAHIPYTPSEQDKLPALQHQTSQCTPGYSYRVDCNSCLCLANGRLVCGNRLCPSHDDMQRVTANDMSGQPCDGKGNQTECVQCQCIGGYKMCRAILNCVPAKRLEPIDETSANQCAPGMIYKKACNKCTCSEHRSLQCTMKTCLNKPQPSHVQGPKVRKHWVDFTRKAASRTRS